MVAAPSPRIGTGRVSSKRAAAGREPCCALAAAAAAAFAVAAKAAAAGCATAGWDEGRDGVRNAESKRRGVQETLRSLVRERDASELGSCAAGLYATESKLGGEVVVLVKGAAEICRAPPVSKR